MEKQVIVAEMVQSNKSENQVWFVHVTGSSQPEHQGYCKKAYSALQFCFILKARTQLSIDDATVETLKAFYAEHEREARWAKINARKEAEAKAQENAEEADAEQQQEPEQPKKRGRKPGSRKNKEVEVAA